MKHELKTWPEHFRAVINPDEKQRKLVEIRKDDRGYEVGDILNLREYNPDSREYTESEAIVTVTHCLRELPWVPPGYVAMSIYLCEVF